MGKLGKALVCLAIFGGIYAWINSFKVPNGFSEPGKLRINFVIISLIMKLDRFIGSFSDFSILASMTANKTLNLPPSVRNEERYIEGIRTLIFRPSGESSNRPAIVYYHGGAWILGSPESVVDLTVDLVNDLGAVIISVDYCLAPKYTFPAGFDDCYKVTKYVLANTQEFGIDPGKIAIGGDSAGGNLAAAVSTKLRDEGLANKIKVQLLLIPVLQAHDFQTQSYKANKYDGVLSQDFMVVGWLKYALGKNYNQDLVQSLTANTHIPRDKRDEFVRLCGNSPLLTKTVSKPTDVTTWQKLQPYLENPYFAPLVAKDVSGLPPTILVTAGQDVLKDDGRIYANRLRETGVKTTHVNMASSFHGIFLMKEALKEDYNRAYQSFLPELKKLL